jgi:hypothetical protein
VGGSAVAGIVGVCGVRIDSGWGDGVLSAGADDGEDAVEPGEACGSGVVLCEWVVLSVRGGERTN